MPSSLKLPFGSIYERDLPGAGTGYTTVPSDAVVLRFYTNNSTDQRLLVLAADGVVNSTGQRQGCEDALRPFELGFSSGEWTRADNFSICKYTKQSAVAS